MLAPYKCYSKISDLLPERANNSDIFVNLQFFFYSRQHTSVFSGLQCDAAQKVRYHDPQSSSTAEAIVSSCPLPSTAALLSEDQTQIKIPSEMHVSLHPESSTQSSAARVISTSRTWPSGTPSIGHPVYQFPFHPSIYYLLKIDQRTAKKQQIKGG